MCVFTFELQNHLIPTFLILGHFNTCLNACGWASTHTCLQRWFLGMLPARVLATCSGLSSFCSLFSLHQHVTRPVSLCLTFPSPFASLKLSSPSYFMYLFLWSLRFLLFFSVLSVFQSHVFVLASSLTLLLSSSKPWSLNFLCVVDWKIDFPSSDLGPYSSPMFGAVSKTFSLKYLIIIMYVVSELMTVPPLFPDPLGYPGDVTCYNIAWRPSSGTL